MTDQHRIRWEDKIPHSEIFSDIYFSSSGGLEESMHVFLNANKVSEKAEKGQNAAILEVGFGTGLNFLLARQIFQKSGNEKGILDYIALEKFPLSHEDMRRIKDIFPSLDHYFQDLISVYPLPVPGFHRRIFDGGKTILTLIYGDARETIRQISGKIDICFLDGFSPAKNPELWGDDVISGIADLSRPGATLSTYSCAGAVRERLKQFGFHVEKQPGFGKKKHMLFAVYEGNEK